MVKNGSSIYKVCKKALPYFRDELFWIPGNGKSIRLWHDEILGHPPPQLPHLQAWMTEKGLTKIWDIAEWEAVEPNN